MNDSRRARIASARVSGRVARKNFGLGGSKMVVPRTVLGRREILLTALAIAFSCVWSWSATYTVTTTSDSGPGSLRQAIIDSNSNIALDTIEFNIPAGQCQANGVCVITLATSLPDITDGMTLDATTQPRYGTAPANVCATETAPSYMRVQLETAADHILEINSPALGTTFVVRGFAFVGSSNTDGIWYHTDSRGLVQCNHFGIDGSGTVALDLSTGICVSCYGGGLGGNLWAGTDGDGWGDIGERNVFAVGWGVNVNAGDASHPNWIAGNYFGVGADGVTEMDCSVGVYMRQTTSQSLIGTNEDYLSDALERNVIAHCSTGVYIRTNSGSENANYIIGNWIGHDARGAVAPNRTGIFLQEDSTDIEIRGNRIMGNQTGLYVQDDSTISSASGDNCIARNDSGLKHVGNAFSLDIENNYWGAADGPSGVGAGSGDSVSVLGSGSVDFNPWMTTVPAICASMFADGFESGETWAWSTVVP
jgi:hypothetical protein